MSRALLFPVLLATAALAADLKASYDYIIVGGGPSGLTLADRLSEDGLKSVLVLEAGQAHLNDSRILIPGYLGGTLNDPEYDWMFKTLPQSHANNKIFTWNRGKVLGGSTAINFMAYGRPASGEIDNIGLLDNPGWTWDNLFKYIKKSESFTPPSSINAARYNFTYVPTNHGTTGPIKSSFSRFVSDGQLPWTSGLESLGIPTLKDALGGNDVGAWYAPASIDDSTVTRSDATTAHYIPAAGRRNLRLITGATVSKLLVSKPSNANATATGVEYYIDGTRYTASLTQNGEAILSAGAINSPKILELSGIGDPEVLRPLNIPVIVNLPGVGNNLVDQSYFGLSYELKNSSTVTLDSLADPVFAAQALAEYEASKTGIFTLGVTAYALAPLQAVTNASYANQLIKTQAATIKSSNSSAAVKKLQAIQIAQLLSPKNFGLLEFVAFPGFFTSNSAPKPGKKYVTFTVDLQFPFSRGSLHITSTDYTVQPAIDPNYFESDFDMQAHLLGLKMMRKLAATAGFADIIAAEADPGPAYQTDEELINYIKTNFGTEYHTIGTTAMMPRSMGGVVSPSLVVYGTNNIRVVDLGILPLQISAHPQSTVYGVAEKAADIIRGIITV